MFDTTKLIDPVLSKYVARGLRRAYPRGPKTDEHNDLVAARLMVEDIVAEISAVFAMARGLSWPWKPNVAGTNYPS